MTDGNAAKGMTSLATLTLNTKGYSVCVEILFSYDESSSSSAENKLLEKGRIHDWRLVSARAGNIVPRKYFCLAY